MLVLSRKQGERLYIDCGDRVIVVSVISNHDDSKLRLGIDDPAKAPVYREEIAPESLVERVKRQ